MVDVYNKDTSSPHLGVALCPKLTRQHLFLTPFSKMRVYLAAQVINYELLFVPALCFCVQVMSSTVADALTFYGQDETTETRVFLRMMDECFDCLNVRNCTEGKHTRKSQQLPYKSSKDYRFKVHTTTIYFDCL